MDGIVAGFAVYGVTLIITVSHIARPFRQGFRRIASQIPYIQDYFTAKDPTGEVQIEDEPAHMEVTGYDFISCAMCVGWWVAFAMCLWHMSLWDTLVAYGTSYFLRTLERND